MNQKLRLRFERTGRFVRFEVLEQPIPFVYCYPFTFIHNGFTIESATQPSITSTDENFLYVRGTKPREDEESKYKQKQFDSKDRAINYIKKIKEAVRAYNEAKPWLKKEISIAE